MRERIEGLVKDALAKNPSLFLINLTISADNRIRVIMDGDEGVTVEDCVEVSRAVESNLDESDDFAIDVLSAGLSESLVLPRQYKKNIGRQLNILKKDGIRVKGEVVNATDEDCTITWTVREPKPVGKGKITVTKEAKVPYDDIKEAKVVITF